MSDLSNWTVISDHWMRHQSGYAICKHYNVPTGEVRYGAWSPRDKPLPSKAHSAAEIANRNESIELGVWCDESERLFNVGQNQMCPRWLGNGTKAEAIQLCKADYIRKKKGTPEMESVRVVDAREIAS